MRRVLAIFTAMALLLALAAPASAKKPVKPPVEPPAAGQTCQEPANPETGNLTLVISRDEREVCVDWSPSEGTWRFDVTLPAGSARGVSFNVKDSVPGDYCVPYTTTSTTDSWEFQLTKVDGSWMDACGATFSDSNEPLAFQVFSQWKGPSDEVVIVSATLLS